VTAIENEAFQVIAVHDYFELEVLFYIMLVIDRLLIEKENKGISYGRGLKDLQIQPSLTTKKSEF
jgi:hypothetical protein